MIEFIKLRFRRRRLLKLLLANPQLFHSGLCSHTYGLYMSNIITIKECEYLLDFIRDHRPKPGSKHYDAAMDDFAYFWEIGKWEPRKKWLKDKIRGIQ